MSEIIDSKDYLTFLNDIKKDIQNSRIKAALSINKELILLYWRIGKGILDRQQQQGWGSKVIEQLSLDLKHDFPDVKGFSLTNLKYMRILASRVNSDEMSPQAVDQIPWGHLRILMDAFENKEMIFWYIKKTIENGWSRNILSMNIGAQAHLTFGTAQTNFIATLPNSTSDLAQQVLKSKYNFDFLGVGDDVHERIIEKGLIDHIRNFLLELGNGFAFMGSQHRVELAGEEFFIDLLMYHVKLKCYVVIELKAGKFKPEYVGKLGFYTTAIDHEVKDDLDNPTIGLLLCQSANKIMVDYCLRDTKKPMGVSEYSAGLPEKYKNLLPTPEQFQHLMDTLPEQKKED